MLSIVLFFALVFGIVSSVLGNKKGMAGTGFALGFLLGPIGLVIVLVSNGNRKPCPTCRELVHTDARKCRFCGYEFPAPMVVTCPKCRHDYAEDLTGCDFCGAAKPKDAMPHLLGSPLQQ